MALLALILGMLLIWYNYRKWDFLNLGPQQYIHSFLKYVSIRPFYTWRPAVGTTTDVYILVIALCVCRAT